MRTVPLSRPHLRPTQSNLPPSKNSKNNNITPSRTILNQTIVSSLRGPLPQQPTSPDDPLRVLKVVVVATLVTRQPPLVCNLPDSAAVHPLRCPRHPINDEPRSSSTIVNGPSNNIRLLATVEVPVSVVDVLIPAIVKEGSYLFHSRCPPIFFKKSKHHTHRPRTSQRWHGGRLVRKVFFPYLVTVSLLSLASRIDLLFLSLHMCMVRTL